MDSTGEPGKIQVNSTELSHSFLRLIETILFAFIQLTKESAEELQSFGIVCDYRGKTFVKGRGKIPTYFARVNERLEFEKETKPVTAPFTFEC